MTERDLDLRADAARNRDRILDVARTAFSAEGIDISMAEIARRAGVGFATAQRRFPTKDDLIREIFLGELADLEAAIEQATTGGGGPWEIFTASIRACAAHQAEHPGLSSMIAEMLSLAAVPESPIAQRLAAVVDQAARAELLRADVTLNDVLALLKGNAGVVALSAGSETSSSARFIDLALRGLQKDSPRDISNSISFSR